MRRHHYYKDDSSDDYSDSSDEFRYDGNRGDTYKSDRMYPRSNSVSSLSEMEDNHLKFRDPPRYASSTTLHSDSISSISDTGHLKERRSDRRKYLEVSKTEECEEPSYCKSKSYSKPIRGPRGPEGKCGPRGPPGCMGPRGPPGPCGKEGKAGPAGKNGAKGEKGPRGPEGAPGRQGFKGARGEMGPCGPMGPKGPVGPAGPRGEPGRSGAGSRVSPCPIEYRGIGGVTGPCLGVTGTSGNYLQGVYYLARGPLDAMDWTANLYISTGDTGDSGDAIGDPAWIPVCPDKAYKYFEQCGVVGASTEVGIIWEVEATGNRSQIQQENTNLAGPDSIIIDTTSGGYYEPALGINCPGVTGSDDPQPMWRLAAEDTAFNKTKCVNIEYNGIGGLSPPTILNIDNVMGGIIYFLDYSQDAKLFTYTKNIQGVWSCNLEVPPNDNFYYFYESRGKDGVASTDDTIIGGIGQSGDKGVIWLVEPSRLTATSSGEAIRLDIACNLQDGDIIFDGNSGRIFTYSTETGEGLFTIMCIQDRATRVITGCLEYTGIFVGSCEVPPTTEFSQGDYYLNSVGQLFVLNGGMWVAVPAPPHPDAVTPIEYYFGSIPFLPNTMPLQRAPWIDIYYVRHPGSLNNACNEFDTVRGCPGVVGSSFVTFIPQSCYLLPGDKFYDCKSGRYYVYAKGSYGPGGAPDPTACLTYFGWSDACTQCETNDCNGLIVGCILYRGFFGPSPPTIPAPPVNPMGGPYYLGIDGTLYESTGATWIILLVAEKQYYYMVDDGDYEKGEILYVQRFGSTISACGIAIDPPATINQVFVIAEECALRPGCKFLDCCTQTLYTLGKTTDEDTPWTIDCVITGGTGGGPIGPVGPPGPEGPTGPPGIGVQGFTGAIMTVNAGPTGVFSLPSLTTNNIWAGTLTVLGQNGSTGDGYYSNIYNLVIAKNPTTPEIMSYSPVAGIEVTTGTLATATSSLSVGGTGVTVVSPTGLTGTGDTFWKYSYIANITA